MNHPFDGEAPLIGVTRSEMPNTQWLLGKVVALAASDCKRALTANAGCALTNRELIEAASACRFFLTDEGRAMVRLTTGVEGLRLATALAETTLRRLRIDRKALLANSNADWCRTLDKLDMGCAPAVAPLVRGRQEAFAFDVAA